MEPIYKKYSKSKFDEQGRLIDFKIDCPDNFNFGYDVVDAIAEEEPDRRALVYLDENGYERIFTFKEISDLSSQTANSLIGTQLPHFIKSVQLRFRLHIF